MRARARDFVAVACLFFLLFVFPVASARISSDKGEYFKGEVIRLRGGCGGDKVLVSAVNVNREVFEKKVECVGKRFEFSYEIAFSDPSGVWVVSASSLGRESSVRFRVRNVRESQFYVVTFLSPSKQSYYRTEDLNIVVKVTDANKPVENALVFAWTVFGERVRLKHVGSGIYSLVYWLPPNAPLGAWRILVAVERIVDGKRFGGESDLIVGVEGGRIMVDVVKPVVKNFDVGAKAMVEVRASYLNGEPPAQAFGVVSFNGRVFEMSEVERGVFSVSLELEGGDVGAKNLFVSVEDGFGNKGSVQVDFVVRENPVLAATRAAPYATVLAAVSLGVLFFFLRWFGGKSRKRRLEREERTLVGELKRLQRDYFERASLSRDAYRRKSADLEARLLEVRKKLKTG